MNLIQLQKKFNTHLKCIRHLEKVRWNNEPICPHCESDRVTKRKFNSLRQKHGATPIYHCNSCNRDFSVLTGTIFEASNMPLQKWFMLISMMLNARKGISAMNIMRNLGVTYKTAWYSAMRVRCAMLDQATMLEGIVEMDEMYVGGKPRKRNPKSGKMDDSIAGIGSRDLSTDDWKTRKNKRGRGADKIKVVGMVERGEDGRVAMRVQDSLTGQDLLRTLKRYVNTDKEKTTVMTDDFRSYKVFDRLMLHYTVNHSEKQYVRYMKGVKDSIHTNTIEGVWSIIKNGIRGQYHVLSKKYLPFYLAEAAYKYNRRSFYKKEKAFDETIINAVNDEKCSVNYKPKKYPKFLAYRRRKKKKELE